jgi:hypothetical protein
MARLTKGFGVVLELHSNGGEIIKRRKEEAHIKIISALHS